jgi:hypothetical protein
MIKSVFAATAALSMSAGAAFAGPYVNVEANSGFVGSDYQGTVTDAHVGYEGPLGESAAWYIQGGPALVSPDGAETEVEFSGKGGASVALTDALSLYGEVSFITGDDDTGYGTKAGIKYSF